MGQEVLRARRQCRPSRSTCPRLAPLHAWPMQLCGDCSTFPYARQSTRDGGTKSPAWMPTTWPTSNAYAGSVTSPLRIANGIIAHGEPQEMPIVRGQQLARCPVVSLPSAPQQSTAGS